MSLSTRICVLLLLAGAFFAAIPGEAQANYHRGRWGHRNGRGYRGGRSAASGMAAAYAQQMRTAAAIRAAQAEVVRSHAALKTTRVKLEREFAYSDSLAATSQSYREGLRVINEATAKLKDNPEYAAVLFELRDVKEQLSSFGAVVDRTALGKRTKELEARLDALRHKALDDNPDVRQAREQMHVSAVNEGELTRKFEGSITHSPQWNQASQSLDAARKKLAQAHAVGNRGYGVSTRRPSSRNHRPHR